MDLFHGLLKATSRLIGFSLISLIMLASIWTFGGFSAKISLLLYAFSFLICWATYDRFVGDLSGDVAIFIRLIMAKSGGFLSYSSRIFQGVLNLRHPPAIPEEHYEIARWADVESSTRVRRMLQKGRLSVFLGQFRGKPQVIDFADKVGKFYISAPDRTGKTHLIKQMIASILLEHPYAKRDYDFYFVDITRDLAMFRPLGRYTHDMKEAIKLLQELGKEVERRNQLREKNNHADWWYEIAPAERPKTVVLIIDEAIQVLKEGGDALAKAWSALINIGWKNGILLITTSLYTRGDLIPTEFTALMRGKVCGNMGTRQGWLNVVEIDYYEKYKEQLEDFVNQRWRFALCIRPDKPVLFQTVFVPKDRLMELVEQAVLDPNDWREVGLTIWFNRHGKIGSEELARLTRSFVEANATNVRANTIHKVSTLELLRHAVMAGVACHNGRRNFYTPTEAVTSYGMMLELWDTYVLAGGLERRVPNGEELAKKAA